MSKIDMTVWHDGSSTSHMMGCQEGVETDVYDGISVSEKSEKSEQTGQSLAITDDVGAAGVDACHVDAADLIRSWQGRSRENNLKWCEYCDAYNNGQYDPKLTDTQSLEHLKNTYCRPGAIDLQTMQDPEYDEDGVRRLTDVQSVDLIGAAAAIITDANRGVFNVEAAQMIARLDSLTTHQPPWHQSQNMAKRAQPTQSASKAAAKRARS